jgi:hypothetical protein
MIIGKIGRIFVSISNKLTPAYEKKFGLWCDIYFPIQGANANADGNYDETNIFSSHGTVTYASTPNSRQKYYIPHLFRKESMSSSEAEWNNLYLEEDTDQRAFIECPRSKELPIQTKVIVYIEDSTVGYTVEKKTVIQGPSGHFLMRMYLNPLTAN